ncbi:hypothetical protein K2X83_02040 [Patescibacteria group bacterium]|nr:hypothetical protein [Patescibacteria group bacterium]
MAEGKEFIDVNSFEHLEDKDAPVIQITRKRITIVFPDSQKTFIFKRNPNGTPIQPKRPGSLRALEAFKLAQSAHETSIKKPL